ncbi:hypothetical protein CQW23_09880 [Capsicum baccatum]|uniref:Uncharacterized protein n=1 Tax=Capsicum baccatum TaxID=33114 RepID=A0A2G2WY26_CAPBA|nr:hypothetical protein CQW23_09880 [Capsicum baccatum]
MNLVTMLLRHSGEWISEIRYDNYLVDGIVIHGKMAYHDLMNAISTQLKIDVSLKRIHVKYVVQGNSSALEIHNDMAVKLFLQILKAESIFGKYPLYITTSDIVIDRDDVDADDMTIECYDFVKPSELTVVVVGSSSSILSRKFIEFRILGTDNLSRTLLMYLSNSLSAASVFFPTILCNSRKFNKTTTNRNMWYVSFNLIQEARPLNSSDFNDLVMNGAEFATPFKENDLILNQINHELLYHDHNKPVPGGWCLGDNVTDKYTLWGDAKVPRPSLGSKRLEKGFVQIFTNGTFRSSQCIYEWSSLKDVNILKIQILENVFFLPETQKESHKQEYTEDQVPHVVFLLAILIES